MGTRKHRYIALGALGVTILLVAFSFVYFDMSYFVDVDVIPIWRVFSD